MTEKRYDTWYELQLCNFPREYFFIQDSIKTLVERKNLRNHWEKVESWAKKNKFYREKKKT